MPRHRVPFRSSPGNVVDPVAQTSTPAAAAATGLAQWEGLGEAYPGFTVTAVPPDPNIAVGPNHIVQWVNNGFVVFDKSGHQVQAPIDDSTFWSASATCNQGGGFSDPIVQYDRAANRWLVGEVAIPILPPFFGQWAQCFAVSTTSDPTGSYYMWAYGFGSNTNDYPKIGVWPDGYYVTWNIFDSAGNFSGAEACAFDRAAMLSGASAPARVYFKLSSTYASLLPSDLDGATAPPAGSPNFMMNIDPGSGALNLWKFHVDFVTPSKSAFTGPTSLAGVAAFTAPCFDPTTQGINQECIPQPDPSHKLDALGDRLMYRLAYRNFGDHESLVANHTVQNAGGNTGVRWYEVRSPNGTPTIYQQGSFAPDTTDNRWMASIAMDKAGDIGVGYSVSSSGTYPSIRYTGRQVGEPLGTLEAETTLVAGGGSQTGYNRWGDYSAMRIDPSDDCTLWYTQEYQATTQSANWNTRIGSFSFASCANSKPAPPSNLSANAGNAQVGLTWTASSGATSYNIYRSTTSGGSYTSIGSSNSANYTDTTVTNGTTYYYVVTAVNAAGESGYSNQASATPQAPPAAPSGLTATAGNAQVSLSWTGSAGASSYNVYRSTTSGGPYTKVGSSASASYTDTGLTNGATYYYVVTALNVGGESGPSNQASATPQAPPSADFSLSASSSTMTVTRGSSGNDVITVSGVNSYSGTVSLTLSGLPPKTSYSFTPSSVTASNCSASCGNSTLKISTNRRAQTGTYGLTVTGKDGTHTHTTGITLTIQ